MSGKTKPKVWLLLADKIGDNKQASVVADIAASQLGWQIERKQLHCARPWQSKKPRSRATLHHLDKDCLGLVQPPWPDLIIAIGRRLACVAMWIQAQSTKQNKIPTKVVLVGKPAGCSLSRYALIITTRCLHFAPPMDNIVALDLPLIYVDEQRIAAARQHWSERFASLPKPLVGILVGGKTDPYAFNAQALNSLMACAHAVQAMGGTAVFSTSRRTPAKLRQMLLQHKGSIDLIDGTDSTFERVPNPHLALIGEADALAVTEDSISMLVEAVRLAKPLSIIKLPLKFWGPLYHKQRALLGAMMEHYPNFSRLLARCGLLGVGRNLPAFQQYLQQLGVASNTAPTLAAPASSSATLSCDVRLARHLKALWH